MICRYDYEKTWLDVSPDEYIPGKENVDLQMDYKVEILVNEVSYLIDVILNDYGHANFKL